MKKLALKILQEETDAFKSQSRLRDDVIDAMIRFKKETEQLTIPAVVGQSEQYFCQECGKQIYAAETNVCLACLEKGCGL